MAEIKIRLPDIVRRGDVVEVKTLALAPALSSPDAEFDASGLPIPHYVGMRASFDGTPLLHAEFGPGVSRNVMFAFGFKIDRSGVLELVWTVRDGSEERRQVPLVLKV